MPNKSNHSPTVSVCLPVLNGKRYLAAALESVLSQSFDDFELIVIDDMSDDESFEIAKSFSESDSRIKLRQNGSRLGALSNFNQCFKVAEGRYIKPFSQDDLLHPEMLQQSVAMMESEPDVALVSVGRSLMDSNGEVIRADDLPIASHVVTPERVIDGKEVFSSCVNPLINYIGESSTVMFKTAFAGSGYDRRFSQLADLELWLRILMTGKYYFIPDNLCHYRCHPHSLTAKNIRSLRLLQDFVRFRKKYAGDIQPFQDIFMDSNVTWLSRYYQALVDQKILPQDNVFVFETDTSIAQTEESTEFLELALHALGKIARDSGFAQTSSSGGKSHNERLIEALEREVQVLLSSRSWRITKLLRDFSGSPVKANGATDTEQIGTDQQSSDTGIAATSDTTAKPPSVVKTSSSDSVLAAQTDLDEQTAYINYLQEQIMQIKMSRSWTITRPLRILERALKTQ